MGDKGPHSKKGFYTVGAGDSWESIAGKTTGDQRNFLRLMEANGGYLRPGMQIKIPGSVRNGPAFISNKTAASFGLATSDQLRSAYAENGTGGYKSARLPMGAFNGGYNPNANAPSPNISQTSLVAQGFQNNAQPQNPAIPPAQAATGQQAAMQWQVANPVLSGPYNTPTTGQSTAAAWAAANKPQAAPPVGSSGFVPATIGPNTQNPIQQLFSQIGNNNGISAAAPAGSGLSPGIGGLRQGLGLDPSSENSLIGKTELKPGENMYKPTSTGAVAPSTTGQPAGPPPQYTTQQTSDAKQKYSLGMASQADLNIMRADWVSQGKDPAVFDKYTAGKVPPSPTNAPVQADSATSGWNWNEPTASGYVSPSGYFVPYAQKKVDSPGVYDYETGKFHPRTGRGGNGRPVHGLRLSHLAIGLRNWRY